MKLLKKKREVEKLEFFFQNIDKQAYRERKKVIEATRLEWLS